MKKLLSASALSLVLAATTTQAGSLVDPVIEAPVIVEEAASSSAGAAVPLLLLALVAIALASNSGGGGVGTIADSDARLKTDITQVGITHMGLPLYQFRYIGGDAVFEGVMAQDVAKVMPQAVVPSKFGYMAVDYAQLGLEMRQVK